MNGVHDLGGMDGFGPVPYAMAEPTFHEPWEGRIYGLVAAGAIHGLYGSPRFRHAIERIEPERYLSSSYYARWLIALSTLLVESGSVTVAELETAAGGPVPMSRPVRAPHRNDPGPTVEVSRFAMGDRVRVRNMHPLGHTRCPRYVRGGRGTIVRCDGPASFDDVEAHSDGKRMEPLYGVRFEAAELWGEDAEPGVSVYVDLFESYLEAG